jgi:AraC-like DNA-binding protein
MTKPSLLVRARALTGFTGLIEKHQGNVQELMATVGIPMGILEDPEAAFPLSQFAALLDHTAKTLGLPDMGMRLATCQDVSVLGAVALVVNHSTNVESALQSICRHIPYHSPGLSLRLTRDNDWAYFWITHDQSISGAGRRHLNELATSVAIAFIRLAANEEGRDWKISFEHSSELSPTHYRQALDCTVLLDQANDVLVFPAKILDKTIDSANNELHAMAERFIRHVVRRFPLDVGNQVEALLERQLASGKCTLPMIAEQLQIPKHELQRRLAARGLCFEDIIDGLRRSRAEEYLPYTEIPLTQVADLLGYTSQSSFTRACRRWFGASPQALRRQQSSISQDS